MGFPVKTDDGIVNVVGKLPGGVLVAEDGSKLIATTSALKAEVIEAAVAVGEAVDEVLDVVEAVSEAVSEVFGGEEEPVDPAEPVVEEEVADGSQDEAEAPQAA